MWKFVLPLLTVLGISSVEGKREFLRSYNGKHFLEYIDIPVLDCSLLLNNLKPSGSENATIIVHGFPETLQGESVRTIVEAYLIRKVKNVLAFEYILEPKSFEMVLPRIPKYGESLASAVACLVDAGIRPHLIGYGVGAHVAGQAGKVLKNKGKTLPRITGLDPAGLFVPRDVMLNREHAEMVDVIHTDGGNLGHMAVMGTVDFFPNFGLASQPGCAEEKYMVQVLNLTKYIRNEFLRNPMETSAISLCSHQRSYQFYAESIFNEDSFYAIKKFGVSACTTTGDIMAYMGLAVPPSATGCYFLNTKATCPFGSSQYPVSRREANVLCNQK